MSKHTIVVKGGRRLVIQKSKTSAGAVHVELLGADRQSMATFSVDAVDCGIIMLAFESVAQSIEREVERVGPGGLDRDSFEVIYGGGPLAAMAGGAA
jgi:hypothetical protein